MDQFSRTRMLVGDAPLDRLHNAKVAVFGVGGVGGFCVEALARAGVGELHLYDDDTVSLSNINRQIIALHSTIGQPKVEVMARRILDINPDCKVKSLAMFYTPQNADEVDLIQYDYVIDAIDTVTAKLELVVRCTNLNVPIICSMGSANKLDPMGFVVADISKTDTCPLARIMRKELRKRGINHLRVVYSKEEALTPLAPAEEEPPVGESTRIGTSQRRQTPGSIAYVPGAAGLVLASAVIRAIADI